MSRQATSGDSSTTEPVEGGNDSSAEEPTERVDFDDEGISKGDLKYSRNTVFHILRNKRRRGVLFYLSQYESPVTMRELSEQVASWERDIPLQELAGSQRETTHVSLYQTHLPTLDDHDIIDYDKDRGMISTAEGLGLFEPYLEPGDDEVFPAGQPTINGTSWRSRLLKLLSPPADSEIQWARYYLAAAMCGAVLTVASIPQSPLDIPLLVAPLFTITFVSMIAFAHTFYESGEDAVGKVERLIFGRSFR